MRIRPDLREIPPYRPGRSIVDVAREWGLDVSDVIKLASNECPLPPFPEVQAAVAAAAGTIHRYPDNDAREAREAIAAHVGVDPAQIWVGAGSSELLRIMALAVGGPGTSALYAWPSFVIYRLATTLAMSEPIEVPLDDAMVHDPEAMLAALRDDTTIVYLCNPNNPTGTLLDPDQVARFIERVPPDVVVVVDEAYHEYVTVEGHHSAIGLVGDHPNLVVARTLSKIYGLAGLRIGYVVGQAETVAELRCPQAPFSVNSLAQVAAVEALRHPERVEERRELNRAGRERIERGLAELGVPYVPSQTNFVFFRPGPDTALTADTFLGHGVVIRGLSMGWVRVTVGSDEENRRFLEVLAAELDRLARR